MAGGVTQAKRAVALVIVPTALWLMNFGGKRNGRE